MNPDNAPIIGAISAAVMAIGGLLRWVHSSFAKRDTAIHDLQLALAEQKGKTDVLTTSIAASEARMATALEGVRQDIAGMTGRLDRLLEAIMLERKNPISG